jgi:hypothetical protein
MRSLAVLELFTGVAAVTGGVLLAGLVGGDGIVAGSSALAHRSHARQLSALFGVGLVGFEIVEASWIGFQPLELVFGAIGVGITALATRARHGTVVLG